MADYNIKNIYEGGANSFSGLKENDPDAIYTGYSIPAGELGTPTNPMVANQIEELNKTLNQGVIPIEIGAIDPKVFDTIPKQHFTEMRRMAELTGAKISVHAPVIGIEPSGLDPQGREEWSEQSRRAIEEQLKTVVDKTIHVDKNGGVPITIHASNIPLAEWEKRDGEIVKIKDMVVDRETGQLSMARLSDMYRPNMTDPEEKDLLKITERLNDKMTPDQAIESMNASQWRNSVLTATMGLEKADEILREAYPAGKDIFNIFKAQEELERENKRKIEKGKQPLEKTEKEISFDHITPEQREVYMRIKAAEEQVSDSQLKIHSLFDKAYKYGDDEEKRKLAKIANNFSQIIRSEEGHFNMPMQTQAMRRLVKELSEEAPEQFKSATEFATEKSAETFANVAMHSYEKGKENKMAPSVISIENIYQGLGFARGEDMKNLIVKSRENFVKEFVNKKKGNEKEGGEMAEKIIGMTFDVGHLNMFKKSGFNDKDLVAEADKVKEYVKHIHITDNFGYDDSHLAPGMGNVPMKDLLKALKAGDSKARKIVEAGGFIPQFKSPAFSYNLEGMGSSMFKDGETSSYWGQSYFGADGSSSASFQRGYFGGYGGMIPQLSYETFGAGFAQLPAELGGQRQGGGQGGRMSGRPME